MKQTYILHVCYVCCIPLILSCLCNLFKTQCNQVLKISGRIPWKLKKLLEILKKCQKNWKKNYFWWFSNKFRNNCCPKYPLFQKLFQIKVVKYSVLYQKISGRICLSPSGGELEASKNWHFWNITMYITFVRPPYEKTGNHTDKGEFGI